jgi:hypothetical protein
MHLNKTREGFMHILILFSSLIFASNFDMEASFVGNFDTQEICETVGENILAKRSQIDALQYHGFKLDYICVETQ